MRILFWVRVRFIEVGVEFQGFTAKVNGVMNNKEEARKNKVEKQAGREVGLKSRGREVRVGRGARKTC